MALPELHSTTALDRGRERWCCSGFLGDAFWIFPNSALCFVRQWIHAHPDKFLPAFSTWWWTSDSKVDSRCRLWSTGIWSCWEMTSRKCWSIQRFWLAVDTRCAPVFRALVWTSSHFLREGGLSWGMPLDRGRITVGQQSSVCSATCGPKFHLSMLVLRAQVCC